MSPTVLLASAIYNPDAGHRERCRVWVETHIARGDGSPPDADVVRDLLLRQKGTPFEPFVLGERHLELAVLLVRLAFSRRGVRSPVIIGSREVPLLSSGLEIAPDLSVRYHHFWGVDAKAKQFAETDPWLGAWRFRAAQGPPDVVRGQGYPVSAQLMAGDQGIRLVVRVANGIPLVDLGKWKVSVGGLADARAAGFRVKRLRGDTFLVEPDEPEAALRFMGCLMEGDVLTVREKTWTLRVLLAPPESGTVRLPAALTSPGWHRLPWLETPEAHPEVRCVAWMNDALRTFLPQPDRSPRFEIFPA
jgi:hypothetical protein